MKESNEQLLKKFLKIETELEQLEVLPERKETLSPLSLWMPNIAEEKTFVQENSYGEDVERQLNEIKKALKEYLDLASVVKRTAEGTAISVDKIFNVIGQQYIAVLLQKFFELEKKSDALKENIAAMGNSLKQISIEQQNIQENNDDQKKLLKSVERLLQDLSTKISQENFTDKNIEQTRAEIKDIQLRIEQVAAAVQECSAAIQSFREIFAKQNQTEKIDVERYNALAEVFHELSELIYDEWGQHAEKYRSLDNNQFNNNERMSMSNDLNRKLDAHINVMNYFIELAFNVRSIMDNVDKRGGSS